MIAVLGLPDSECAVRFQGFTVSSRCEFREFAATSLTGESVALLQNLYIHILYIYRYIEALSTNNSETHL